MSRTSRQPARPTTGRQFWQQFNPAQVPQILAGLQAALRRPCLLCRAPATVAAIFQPDDPLLWGGRPGKLRVCPYGLCPACLALPATLRSQQVEARLRHLMALAARRN